MKYVTNGYNRRAMFATYIRLYPGKGDVIADAMDLGESIAANMGLTGKEYSDRVEAEVLDAVDP